MPEPVAGTRLQLEWIDDPKLDMVGARHGITKADCVPEWALDTEYDPYEEFDRETVVAVALFPRTLRLRGACKAASRIRVGTAIEYGGIPFCVVHVVTHFPGYDETEAVNTIVALKSGGRNTPR